jgi:quinol monooxygenase YgiN
VSITRINEFQAKDGQAQRLRDFLTSIVSAIEASEGCRLCRLLQDLDDDGSFVVIEFWESVDAHKASIKDIQPEQLEEIMQLLSGSPQGRYFAELNASSTSLVPSSSRARKRN